MKKEFSDDEYDAAKDRDRLPIRCYDCNKVFLKDKKQIARHINYTGSRPPLKHCSRCANKIKQTKIEVSCHQCDVRFFKQPSQLSKSGADYCSQSCAAKVNNTKHPKRAQTNSCKVCSKAIYAGYTYCRPCWKDQTTNTHLINRTLEETLYQTGPCRFSPVRSHARTVALRALPVSHHRCSVETCGYSTIVEVAHIKGISLFELTTPIAVINSTDNLSILCKNHHAEFDRHLLNRGSIKSVSEVILDT